MKRFYLAFFLGLLVSLGLFGLMHFMILNNQQAFKKTDNLKMVEFVRLKKKQQIQKKERHIPEPPPPKKRPPPPTMPMTQANQISQQKMPDMAIPNLDLPLQTSRFGGPIISGVAMGKATVSTGIIPLVRVQPQYPMRAQSRRIEGWVKVAFTITATGTVRNAKVVESHPNKVFDRAALKAISRWKFKPKIIAGEAVEQLAAQVLQFKLSR